MWLDDERTALYRLYGEGGALLYIGISHQPEVRFDQHSKDKHWWPDVVRRDVQWFDDRPTAAEAEAEAIRSTDPEHNRTYSPRWDRHTIRDVVADDGVREVSQTLVRAKLTGLVRGVADSGPAVALLNHGKREAYLVSIEFYEQAAQDRLMAEALKKVLAEMDDAQRAAFGDKLAQRLIDLA